MTHRTNGAVLSFTKDGAEHFRAAALSALPYIQAALSGIPSQQAGVRIRGVKTLIPLLAVEGPIGSLAAKLFRRQCLPVRAILFDKTAEMNWSLAWHQDRTICVRQRIEVDGYGPWTIKAGMQHVAPPFDLLARMVTLRVHLDDVSAENSPLLIAPGSHKAGRVPIGEYAEVVRRFGSYACLADAGDVWAYATPILHASEAAQVTGCRRVLQVDYSADDLTGGLEWLGV